MSERKSTGRYWRTRPETDEWAGMLRLAAAHLGDVVGRREAYAEARLYYRLEQPLPEDPDTLKAALRWLVDQQQQREAFARRPLPESVIQGRQLHLALKLIESIRKQPAA